MAGTNETSIRSYNFFLDTTIAGAGTYAENEHDFVDLDTGITHFLSHTLIFSNDGGTDLFFRFQDPSIGGADHGRVGAGETLQMDFKRVRRIWFRGTPGLAFRFWAW